MTRAACCAAFATVLLATTPALAQERATRRRRAVRAARQPGALGRPRAPAARGRRAAGTQPLGARRSAGSPTASTLVRGERRRYPGATREVYQKGPSRWQVSYFAKVPVGEPRKEIAQILIDDRGGGVLEAYKDYKVAWTMARGYDGRVRARRELADRLDPARGAVRRRRS